MEYVDVSIDMSDIDDDDLLEEVDRRFNVRSKTEFRKQILELKDPSDENINKDDSVIADLKHDIIHRLSSLPIHTIEEIETKYLK